ncbi:MAG: hypothetical protein HY000_39360 [Planctomycetes bacterium]|nr:hypothetical protein [Planctomycetota bacterium]
MKYFTPQLYVRFNSRDHEVASRADDEWDRAEAEYMSRLQSFRAEMPESVRFIAFQFCLHDAEFLSLVESPESVQVRVRKHDTVYVLDYHPTALAEVSVPCPSDVFSGCYPRWLYEEIDYLQRGKYSQEILLSDGRVIRIQFDRVEVHELHPSGTAEKLQAADDVLEVARRISRKRADKGGRGSVTIPHEDLKAIKQAVRAVKGAPLSKNKPSTRTARTT